MITVNPTDPKKDDNSRIKPKKRSNPIKQKKESFDIALNERISFDFQDAIDDLLNDLKEEEKRFLEKQTLYELSYLPFPPEHDVCRRASWSDTLQLA